MSNFDPSLKRLLDQYPGDYLELFCRLTGLPITQTVRVVQTNLPRRPVDADRAFRLENPGPMVLHIEFETSHELGRPDRFLVYNVLLSRQEQCPVQTVVLLMRPDAVSSDLTGFHRVSLPTGDVILEWHYTIVRVWELSPETFLSHPGTAPLALASAVEPAALPALIERAADIFETRPPAESKELAAEAYVLVGLRFDPVLADRLRERIPAMEESKTYQLIYGKGDVSGQIKGLIRFGKKRFGPPDAAIMATLKAITDDARFDRLYDRIESVSSWAELLEQ